MTSCGAGIKLNQWQIIWGGGGGGGGLEPLTSDSNEYSFHEII